MLASWMALERRSFSLVDLSDFIVTVNKGIEPPDCLDIPASDSGLVLAEAKLLPSSARTTLESFGTQLAIFEIRHACARDRLLGRTWHFMSAHRGERPTPEAGR